MQASRISVVVLVLTSWFWGSGLATPGYAASQGAVKKLTEQMDKLKANIAEVDKQLTDLKSQLTKAQDELSKVTKDVDSAQAAVTAVGKSAEDNQAKLRQAKEDLVKGDQKILEKLNTTDPTVSLKQKLDEAQSKADARRAKVLEILKAQPGYLDLVAQATQAREKLATLRATAGVPHQDVADANQAAMNADLAVTKLEQAGVEADPEMAQALKALDEAKAAYDAQVEANRQKLTSDPDHVAAQKALDAVEEAIKSAGANLAEANKKVTAANAKASPLRQQVAPIQAQVQRLQSIKEDLTRQLDELKKKYEAATKK